uniref:Uncharacterized protein n=1 Tax=viral metagenome TaxID=1070528 RepID=A0A6M3LKU3_9ZZZZ
MKKIRRMKKEKIIEALENAKKNCPGSKYEGHLKEALEHWGVKTSNFDHVGGFCEEEESDL